MNTFDVAMHFSFLSSFTFLSMVLTLSFYSWSYIICIWASTIFIVGFDHIFLVQLFYDVCCVLFFDLNDLNHCAAFYLYYMISYSIGWLGLCWICLFHSYYSQYNIHFMNKSNFNNLSWHWCRYAKLCDVVKSLSIGIHVFEWEK